MIHNIEIKSNLWDPKSFIKTLLVFTEQIKRKCINLVYVERCYPSPANNPVDCEYYSNNLFIYVNSVVWKIILPD